MKIKKIGRAWLFPHIAVKIVLLPVSGVLLVYSLMFLNSESPLAIISYSVAFYTLTIWCVMIPNLVRICRRIKSENKYARRWQTDTRMRVSVTLYGAMLWNFCYAILQLGLGFKHHSSWFYALFCYYALLAVMRFILVRHTRKYSVGERPNEELFRYRICGIIFLIMNLALSAMIFFMVYRNKTFNHREITTIALAAYTFTSLILAIVNIFRYKKYNSPVYSASKTISLASASVSMITLESTMLTTFDNGSMTPTVRMILLAATGAAVSAFIIIMAFYMIISATRKLKSI